MKRNRHISKDLGELREKAEARLKRVLDRIMKKAPQDPVVLMQELQTYQIKLEMQNEELRSVQQELEESRNEYVDLYDNAPVGYCTLDANSTIRSINRTGAEMLGAEASRIVNRPFSLFVDGGDRAVLYAHFQDVIQSHRRQTCEVRMHGKGDAVIHARLQTVAAENEGGLNYRTTIIDLSENKRSEAALRESEERLRLAAQAASFGSYDLNVSTRELFRSPELKSLLGLPPDAPSRVPLDDALQFIHQDDRERIRQVIEASMDPRSGGKFQVEHRIVRADGSVIWVNMRGETFFEGEGGRRRPVRTTGVLLDITDRMLAEEALRQSEERFRTLADNIAQLAWMADEKGRVFWYNKRWFDYTGAGQEEMRGWGWQKVHHPDHVGRVMDSFRRSFEAGEEWEETFPLRGRDGGYRWFLSRAIPIRNEGGNVIRWFGTNTDITDRREMEEEIRHMAQHDTLTGLPNRRLFNEIITIEVAQARRNGTKLALFFLDLDRFKEINDTLGHETGDELLKQTAVRLRSAIRTSDTAARIGGDEFNVLITDIFYPEYASEAAQKILNEIRRTFSVKGHDLTLSTSIGISVFPDDGEEIDTLLRYADIAMYYAKEHGRNMYQFYNPVINTRSLERMRLENSLREAIEQNQLRLYFQPLVAVETRKMVSAEALVRWQHPDRGLLEPGQFFAAAEEVGFMSEIDNWVMQAAGVQIKRWIDDGISPPRVTVNLSNSRFQSPGLVKRISGILEETGLPPACLEIEIAELTTMGDIERTIALLQELTPMGVQISIDHFGTGCLSLSHLKRMPVRKLKIDRSFIREIPDGPDGRAVVAAVLLLAHSLKLKVVAAGVEMDDQLSFLAEARCDEAQGFLFSQPLPAERFRELVMAGR
jgi:diguanylate cyclase (GGDEF)-like protein/PAS domain S-box-containing protein